MTTAIKVEEIKEKNLSNQIKWLRSNLFSGGLPMDEKLQNYLNTKIENFINPQNDKRFILDVQESPQILSSSSTYVTASGNEVEREKKSEDMKDSFDKKVNLSDKSAGAESELKLFVSGNLFLNEEFICDC